MFGGVGDMSEWCTCKVFPGQTKCVNFWVTKNKEATLYVAKFPAVYRDRKQCSYTNGYAAFEYKQVKQTTDGLGINRAILCSFRTNELLSTQGVSSYRYFHEAEKKIKISAHCDEATVR